MRKKLQIRTLILGVIGGIVLGSSIGVFATNYLLKAEDVEYVDKDNNATTVQSAITDLYNKASKSGYGELTLWTAEIKGNSLSVSYDSSYIGSACIYGTNPDNYTNVGKIVDNKCVMENLSASTTYYYKVGALDSSMKLYIGTDSKETASATYYSNPSTVYFNPVTNQKCNSTDYTASNSLNENKTGCMKWYAFKEEGGNYSLLLDHNTTAISYYNYNNDNSVMGTRSASELSASYNEVGYDLAQLTSVSGWVVTPRLISANEIAQVVGYTSWNSSSDTDWFSFDDELKHSQGASAYPWLFDYTGNCTSWGCNIDDNSIDGYWTNSKYVGNSSRVWRVANRGNVYWSSANEATKGLRPVIEVPSSILNIS